MKTYDATVFYVTSKGVHRSVRMHVQAPTMVKARRIASARALGDGRRQISAVEEVSLKRLTV